MVLASLGLAACGGGESSESDDTSPTTTEATVPTKRVGGIEVEVVHERVANNQVSPKVSVPPAPPPKELVVRELWRAGGAETKPGDLVGVQYVGLDWKSGKQFAQRWGPQHLYRFRLGSNQVPRSWRLGLQKMDVGDRRELQVPASLSGGKGAQLYVIEIVEVQLQ